MKFVGETLQDYILNMNAWKDPSRSKNLTLMDLYKEIEVNFR